MFFDQYRWIMFFCRGWLMFSFPSKWKHAGVGRNTTSVEHKRKNLADLHCKLLWQHRTKRILYCKKYYLSAFEKNNCAMSAEKYQPGLYNDRCRLVYFLFNPWILFRWCLLGNVRSASPGDCFFFRPRSVIFLGRCWLAFFRSVSVNKEFFLRWANVFLAD